MAAVGTAINYNAEQQQQDAIEREIDAFHGRFIDGLADGRRAQLIETERKIILLWVLSQQAQIKGYRYDGNLLWLFENRAILLREADHNCKLGECHQFSATPGQHLRDALSGEVITASGNVYVCAVSGAFHHCPTTASCACTKFDTRAQQDGFFCPISHRQKHHKMTTVQGYSVDRPIGIDRLAKQMRDEDAHLNDGFDMEMDDMMIDDDLDGGIDGDYYDDRELIVDSGSTIGTDQKLNSEMLDVEFSDAKPRRNADVAVEHMMESNSTAVERLITRAFTDAQDNPSGHPPPKRSTVPPKRQRTVKIIAEMTGDERIEMHMRDMSKKKSLALSVVKLVLSFDAQVRLYREQMYRLGKRATEHVNSQVGKAKRPLTTIECDNLFFGFMARALPKQPRSDVSLYFGRYTNAIMHVWTVVARSPYARGEASQSEKPVAKQKPLKFEKIAFGLIYRIAEGGFNFNASLPVALLNRFGIATVCPDLFTELRDFQLPVVSYDPAVSAAIVDSAHLLELRKHALTNAQPDSKIVNEGNKLIEACYRSVFRELGMDCVKSLMSGADKRETLQAYMDACKSKLVPDTSAENG